MTNIFWLDEIHIKATNVLAKFENECVNENLVPPIPMEDIVDLMFKVRIVFDYLPKDISGLFRVREKIMEINRIEPENRRRFTIGHELGHLVLHCTEGRKRLFRDKKSDICEDIQEEKVADKVSLIRKRKSKRMETEANVFASEILMPSILVKDAFKTQTKDIEKLKQIFKVSRLAMEWKLTNLRLITGKSPYKVVPFY